MPVSLLVGGNKHALLAAVYCLAVHIRSMMRALPLLLWLLPLAAAAQLQPATIPDVAGLFGFNCWVQSGQVELRWLSSWEYQRGAWVVQRSPDGHDWYGCARIPSRGLGEKGALYSTSARMDGACPHYRLLFENDFGQVYPLDTMELALHLPRVILNCRPDTLMRTLHVEYTPNQPAELLLRLYNRMGQQVHTCAAPAAAAATQRLAIRLPFDMPAGTYMAVLTDVEQQQQVAFQRVEWLCGPPLLLPNQEGQ